MADDPDEGLDGYDIVAGDPLEEAEDGGDSRAQPFIDPDLELCPVVPLGFTGGRVVFAMPEGEIRSELASKIGQMLRTDIFACAAGQTFLTYWRSRDDDKFLRDMATVWFVRRCRQMGLWDDRRAIRSLGVWPDEDERLALHLGDEVWRLTHRGKPEKLPIIQALRRRSGPLYKLRPPAPRPGKKAGVVDGEWARATLGLWNFEPIGREGLTGSDVVAGWMMAALLGAFAPFRGHLLINALAGSGKSTLMEYLHALMSALVGEVIDSFTEAGLRNDLAGMARAVLLDEAEGAPGTHGPGVIERAMELLRRMTTGQGGTRRQGDVGGGTVTQTAVGAVAMAGITPPPLGPADASRVVEVRLLPLVQDGRKAASRAEIRAAIDHAKSVAPGMLGRALSGAWRYRADVDELGAAFARAGHDPRTGDLISMLAAGRRLLLFDKPLSEEEADAELAFWAPLLAQREAADTVSNPGADCLAHLMAADSGVHMSNRRETIGGLILRWSNREREYEDVLAGNGLKISEDPSPDGRDGPWLIVANHHPRLEAIFNSTRWRDWRRTLGYTDSLGPEFKTWATPNSLRFGVGVKHRAIALPLTPWLDKRPVVSMAAGIVPLPRSAPVPPAVPPEEVDWPDEF